MFAAAWCVAAVVAVPVELVAFASETSAWWRVFALTVAVLWALIFWRDSRVLAAWWRGR